MYKSKINVNVPQYTSIKEAIAIYYEKSELSNTDIIRLFGKLSSATIAKLKNEVREQMIKTNTPIWNHNYVNTKVAYKTWGIDIEDLVSRYKTQKELGI